MIDNHQEHGFIDKLGDALFEAGTQIRLERERCVANWRLPYEDCKMLYPVNMNHKFGEVASQFEVEHTFLSHYTKTTFDVSVILLDGQKRVYYLTPDGWTDSTGKHSRSIKTLN